MAEKESIQRTKKGLEIPIPDRETVLGNLAKTAKPDHEQPKKGKRRRFRGRP